MKMGSCSRRPKARAGRCDAWRSRNAERMRRSLREGLKSVRRLLRNSRERGFTKCVSADSGHVNAVRGRDRCCFHASIIAKPLPGRGNVGMSLAAVAPGVDLPASGLAERVGNMDTAEIQKRVNRVERWHYKFDLNGISTPISDKTRINRHEQRRRYLFDSLLATFGGSLAGKRVLDLGSNAGFWSLTAIESGCNSVLGIDGRQMHTDQANLVFEVKGCR